LTSQENAKATSAIDSGTKICRPVAPLKPVQAMHATMAPPQAS